MIAEDKDDVPITATAAPSAAVAATTPNIYVVNT